MLAATALPVIAKVLSSSAPPLSLPPELEAAYRQDRTDAQLRTTRRFILCYFGFSLLGLLLDHQNQIPLLPVAAPLRVGVVFPFTLLAFWLLRRPLPAWLHGVAAVMPMLVFTATVGIEARLLHRSDAAQLMLLPSACIFAQTLTVPTPFRYAMRALWAVLPAYLLLCMAPLPHPFSQPMPPGASSFICVAGAGALYERRRRECADRREFLLSEANRLRIEDILRLNAHLERLSSIDGLTGVFNRRYLDAALKRLWGVAADHERWIGVLMVDIDHFKALNDHAGHQHGDYCLTQVAQIIQHTVRAGVDTVARYGGEEFVAILPDANESEVLLIGERIRRAIEAAGLSGAAGTVVTISAGAAAVQRTGSLPITLEEFIAAADQALYQAKRSGRNRVLGSPPLLASDQLVQAGKS